MKFLSFYEIFSYFSLIYSYDFEAEFLASLLQSHEPSEIILIFWFAAQKTFIIIIMLKTAE